MRLEHLALGFRSDAGTLRVVDGVDLQVHRGEILAVVGESGCGKSVTFLSVLGLLPPGGQIDHGQVLFDGQDLRTLPQAAMRQLRGRRIAMIFQDALSSLNPVYSIGMQLEEALRQHTGLSRVQARRRSLALLRRVGIPAPEERIDAYPHELSGGMRQRVMIAMALSAEPELLIADEPTTALDVTVQAQILSLLQSLQHELGMAVVLITHDLGAVWEVADRVAVMYAGQIVEQASRSRLFQTPQHPYTQALLASLPAAALAQGSHTLPTIAGQVPDPRDWPTGCRFAPRCPKAHALCEQQAPPFVPQPGREGVACWAVHPKEASAAVDCEARGAPVG
ncbi:MAG: ABC transporter ATP-binding protein [Polyangiales bacterium]